MRSLVLVCVCVCLGGGVTGGSEHYGFMIIGLYYSPSFPVHTPLVLNITLNFGPYVWDTIYYLPKALYNDDKMLQYNFCSTIHLLLPQGYAILSRPSLHT